MKAVGIPSRSCSGGYPLLPSDTGPIESCGLIPIWVKVGGDPQSLTIEL